MAGRVHAHQPVAPLPVDRQLEPLADLRRRLVGRRHMDDLVLGLAGDGGRDVDVAAVGRVRMPVSPGCPPEVA